MIKVLGWVLSTFLFYQQHVKCAKMLSHSHDGPYEEVDDFGKRSIGKNWRTGNSAEVMKHFIRLTSDRQNKRGYLWNIVPIEKDELSAIVAFRISGQGKRWFGDGIGLWITQHINYQHGHFHGFTEKYVGIGIALDTFINTEHKGGHKDVSVYVNDGTKSGEKMNDEERIGCDAAIRYHEGHGSFDPVYSSSRLKVQIKGRKLTLEIDEKATGDWKKCYEGDVPLPPGWLNKATFGLTGVTGSLADNHDILRVSLYDRADDPEVSAADSDAMIHHLSKEYDKWMDTESCGVDCKISILQKKIKDYQVDFEHKMTALQEKTKNTVQKLREKESDNEHKIDDLEKTVTDLVNKNVVKKMSHIGNSVNKKIEKHVKKNVIENSGTWKTPFFLLITGICGGSFFLYRKYQNLRKTHLL